MSVIKFTPLEWFNCYRHTGRMELATADLNLRRYGADLPGLQPGEKTTILFKRTHFRLKDGKWPTKNWQKDAKLCGASFKRWSDIQT